MAPLFLDPGLFNRRVALDQPVIAADGAGGGTTDWQELRAVSVRIEPVSVTTRERFDQREAMITHRVLMRANAVVKRGMSFRLGARRLVIVSVHDPDESGRYLVCRCEEER
ncbi:phage head closure protein [Jiella sp. MQZ9-1]|uniref:Phage head closure protein n=1 Tax=Jiella flava TaxID=2816857 RepID=A0A939FUT0_9HYPH|nr:phage head closure protein [Jiella flava]MBO0661830.1 phage head closure protein [Jiella flava]MCD2470470.1 phage head closure protein [Jiella flava]